MPSDVYTHIHMYSVNASCSQQLKTKDLKLVYQKTGQPLKVFCDSDFAGYAIDRKYRSEYVFILAGGATS